MYIHVHLHDLKEISHGQLHALLCIFIRFANAAEATRGLYAMRVARGVFDALGGLALRSCVWSLAGA